MRLLKLSSPLSNRNLQITSCSVKNKSNLLKLLVFEFELYVYLYLNYLKKMMRKNVNAFIQKTIKKDLAYNFF